MARRDLTDRISWDDSYVYVAYSADALALAGEDGDKEVGALAPAVEKVVTSWETLDVERRAGRRGVGRGHARVRRRDLQLDTVTIDVHNDTLGHVKQDRSHPLFVRLYPNPLSEVVRMALGSQLPVARQLALKLAEPETPAELRKAHDKPLKSAIEQGQDAIEQREEAFATAGRVSARIASWREDANRVLLGIEGALQQIASKRGLKADWVDSFFAESDRKGGKGGGGKGGGGDDNGTPPK